MISNKSTTYILLERGTEDVQLLNELYSLLKAADVKSIKSLASSYPLIEKLKWMLDDEISDGFENDWP